jgi:OmcA/MtrC family decaheme c-type cytochrome
LAVWGQVSLTLNLYGETNSYGSTSLSHNFDFLVGDAATVEPYALISSGNQCLSCHQELYAHGGGRRGWDTCVICHGTAGSEDRPPYVAANAPPTTGTTVNFRTMLHKIHRGEDLAHASSYEIIGFGSGAYPNNFGVVTFEEIAFPAMPRGTQECAKCHGTSTAWEDPAPRNHPAGQALPTRSWRATCGACHDSDAAAAHIDVQTSLTGQESCAVCHGPGRDLDVTVVHKVR